MNQNELRIGNYVNDSKTGKVVTVDGIQFTGRIVTHDESYDDWKRGIEPVGIPLTPEILERAGFEKEFSASNIGVTVEETLNFRKYGGTRTYFTGWQNGKVHISPDMNCCASIKLKFVHQLQNLYFALTGEELPIEL